MMSCCLRLCAVLLFGPLLVKSAAADSGKDLGPPVDVVFTARSDGTEQRYVIRLPTEFDATKPHSLLIALHGHGSDRWQFASDARGECRAARDCAAKHQMIYVSPDYRAKTSWMGPAAVLDVLQMIDDLNQAYRVKNVIVCGGSMGGTSALAFAVMHPELIDGVVSLNGTSNLVEYTGFADALAASYGGTKADKPDEYRIRSAELFPERMKMPVGLTTSGRDTIVPPDSTLRLANLLKQQQSPVHLIHRPESGHETSYDDSSEALEFVIEKSDQAFGQSKPVLAIPVLAIDGQPRTIVCLGDSVTGVYYHTGGLRAYPEMLEIGLRQLFPKSSVTVVNAGISGQTTREGLARLDSDVFSKQPDLVTISFGLNDMVRITPEMFRENLELLIKSCHDHKSQVVLCTPNGVINTPDRPIEKLTAYCEIIRDVGRRLSVRVCDQQVASKRLRDRATWTWRLTLSDAIHPNIDGHKRMAEELCRTITGLDISLDSIGNPQPALQHTKTVLQQRRAVRVLAMPPYDTLLGSSLKKWDKSVTVEVTPWIVDGKTLPELEQDAKVLVRAFKPDLVVVAIPRAVQAASDEQFVHSYTWILNWSLSFGHQELDCIVVHPSVAEPDQSGPRDEMTRKLVRAQHFDLIDRQINDKSSAVEVLSNWLVKQRRD